MKVWIEIDSETPFNEGDVISSKNEIVDFHDGDRGTFKQYRKLILRPVENDIAYAARKLIADKLHEFANDILV